MRKLTCIALTASLCACAQEAATPSDEEAETPLKARLVDADLPSSSEPVSALTPPPPRRSVDGIFGFTARSLIEFSAPPDSPHRLTSTYGFPERARWYLEPAGATTGQRSVRYRSGPQVWELFPGASEAARYQDEQELHAFLQLELRRAALMWPRGIKWTEENEPDRDVKTFTHQLKIGGTLRATLAGAERLPSSFSSEIDGTPLEAYRAVKWGDGPLGERPISWTLWHRDAEIWVETIERLHIDIRYVDGHFLPPHLRELPGDSMDSAALLAEVPARVRKKQPLSARSWAEAIPEAVGLISDLTEFSLPGVLDKDPVFELNESGLPTALFLRIVLNETVTLPDGWEEAPGESALSLMLSDGEMPNAAAITRLQQACPSDAKAGTPRLRVRLVDGEPGSSQLLLPLAPSVSDD